MSSLESRAVRLATHRRWTGSLILALVVTLVGLEATAQTSSILSLEPTVGILDWNLPLADPSDPQVAMANASPLIHLTQARTKYPGITGSGYTIAIVDTGIDYTHPALKDRYVGGWDYINNDSNPDDDNGHGTHVAGIATSSDALYGGIAPGANYSAVKVLNSLGSGGWTQIGQGLRWVLDNREKYNIVAVNMSIGTSTTYSTSDSTPTTKSYGIYDELAALKNAGVFVCTAAGNNWASHDPPLGVPGVAYPAADPSTVAVGAVWTADFGQKSWKVNGSTTITSTDYTTAADRIVSFSDRSSTLLDVFAPGAIITSTAYNWEGANADFVNMSGTSMAAPAVAGLAVLIRQAIEQTWAPEDRPVGAEWQDTILNIMKTSAVTIYDGDNENDNVGHLTGVPFKRIDALAALDATVVPEPGTMGLALAGAAALAVGLLRRRPRP